MTTPTVTEIRRHGTARPAPSLAALPDAAPLLGDPSDRPAGQRAPFGRVAPARAIAPLSRAA